VEPGQKKLARLKARLVCLDETGFMMAPLIRRTWAPRGQTPALVVSRRSHEKVSGIGALVVSPGRRRITPYLALHPKKNVRGPEVLNFLRQLRRHDPGHLFLLGTRVNPTATSSSVPAWPSTHTGIRSGSRLRPNSIRKSRSGATLKYGRLSNYAPDDVEQIREAVRREARRVKRSSSLLKAFFRHSELPFRVPR
jgi:hypothetical protein